jgi:N-acetylglucosamine-6-phosphate deacetylase
MDLIGRRYDTGELIRLEVVGDRVRGTSPVAVESHHANEHPWIAPALCDVQVNGYCGQEFSSAALTCEGVERIARQMDAFGIARSCPTVTTNRPEVMLHAVRTIAAACEASASAAYRLPGIHVEGPFISPVDGPRGAHPLAHVRPPDYDEFQRLQEAADGRIRILTMSPEYEGSAAFIRRVAQSGVIVAIGHTAASPEQIRAAADAGATMCTHLGNGSHALIPRHRNYLWAQLADDRLTASLIVDGHHLPPDVVKTFLRAKTPARCVLVSDLAGQAGLPPGRYRGEMCELEVLPDGMLAVADQRELLAGASQPLGVCVANVLEFGAVSLAEAIAMASTSPARLLGIQPGGLEPGDPADLVLFDLIDGKETGFAVRGVVIRGEPSGVR